MHHLSLLLWTPIIGALIVALLPKGATHLARAVALAHAGVAFGLALLALWRFEPGGAAAQLVEQAPWTPETGLAYAIAIGGLSAPLLVLTAGMMFVALIASGGIQHNVRSYHAWMLALETGVFGVFLSRDWSLFYLFWELTLIPLFFLINLWGGPKRGRASLTFLLYTMGGSVFMLVALLTLFASAHQGSFSMDTLAQAAQGLPLPVQQAVLAGLFLGFGVKLPAFPLHGWLPITYVEAPAPVSLVLSAVLSKMGAYGLILAATTLPAAAASMAPGLSALGVISIVYGALLAWRQTDLKAMIACSSASHMGFVLVGLGSMNEAGLMGASLQMVAHSLIAGTLFLLAGAIERRVHTQSLGQLGGLISSSPRLSVLMIVGLLASMGLPGFVGFVAELHTLTGGFQRFGLWIGLASVGVLIGAAAALRTISLVFMGPVKHGGMGDLSVAELVAAAPLVALTVGLGLFPNLALSVMAPTVLRLAALFPVVVS